jgi:hypothetical protein
MGLKSHGGYLYELEKLPDTADLESRVAGAIAHQIISEGYR